MPPEIHRVHVAGQAQLLVVVQTTDPIGAPFGSAQRRQEHRGQDGDDGNHDQQLDQCETNR
jgi:hypothetical protein